MLHYNKSVLPGRKSIKTHQLVTEQEKDRKQVASIINSNAIFNKKKIIMDTT